MKSVPLTAHPRSQVQRAEVTKLRAAGRVPATIYGRIGQPQNLEIILDDINNLLNHSVSENLLVDLNVEKAAPVVSITRKRMLKSRLLAFTSGMATLPM